MRRAERIWRCPAAAVMIAVLTCFHPIAAAAGTSEVGVLLDQFRTENVPNSGVVVDVSTVGDSVLGMVCQPSGILKTGEGGFLVTDLYNKVVWSVNGSSSQLLAGYITAGDLSGEPVGGYADGAADQALFSEPWAIVPFMNGYAVSDPANHVVRYIEGGTVRTAAGNHTPGLADGDATTLSVMFNRPTGLAADDKGNLFIADTNNHAVRRLDSTGRVITCTTLLKEPTGLFWQDDVLYIADSGNDRICKLTDLYSGGGEQCRLTVITGEAAGPGEDAPYLDGPASEARFCNPQGVTAAADGTIYVADTGNGAVRKIAGGQVTTLVRLDSQSMGAYPVSPRGLELDQDVLYITDSFSRTVLKLPLR